MKLFHGERIIASITYGSSLSVDMLVLVPAQIYVRRIIRHKLVLKSNLQIKTQIPKILNRLKNEPESVLARRYVKLFRVNIGGILERVQQQHTTEP